MDAAEWAVLVAALGAIAWVNWYFFFSARPAVAAVTSADGAQEIRVGVRGGYDPAALTLRAGRPVRLLFDRQETSGCSEEVVIPDFGIRRFLPAFQTTAVEFTPDRTGSFVFTCGMGMLQGRLLVVSEEA